MPDQVMNCPVCLGVPMSKAMVLTNNELQLDYCRRCGGMWFDRGEVDQLRKCSPKALKTTILLTEEAERMRCHSCQATFNRSGDSCPACGWLNRISCPACDSELKSTKQGRLTLDVCTQCQGIWFDNTELAQIWNVAVASFTTGEPQKSEPRDRFYFGDVVDLFIFDSIFPSGAVHAVGDLIGSLPEAAGSIVEGAGALAGSIFEATPAAAEIGVDATGELAGGAFEGIGSIFDIFN